MTVPRGMLYGLRAVSDHLEIPYRAALYLVAKNRLPVFRQGKIICSSRSALDTWLAEREAEARKTAS